MSAIADSFIETAVLDLDALRRMSYAELDSLYRGARCPRVISELNADTRGAMLAWRSPRTGPIAWWLRTFGASQSFPWEGKTFAGEQEEGRGINRVTFFGKRRWFPFQTRFAKSFSTANQPSNSITPAPQIHRSFVQSWTKSAKSRPVSILDQPHSTSAAGRVRYSSSP